MIVQEHFLKKLRSAFDLNIYEVKIWTALLSRGIASAGELSDISGVPRSRSYDILESLEKKGFIITKIGKPIKYIAVKPEEIVRRIKGSLVRDTETKLKVLEKVKQEDIFKDIELLFKQGIEHIDPSTLSGAIKGRNNIYSHLENMIGNAKKSIVIVTSPSGFLRKMNVLKSRLNKLSSKGVKIKIGTKLTDEVKEVMKELNGVQISDMNIDARFCIIDGKEIMFMISDDKIHENYDSAVWVTTPFFATALENLFNSCLKNKE